VAGTHTRGEVATAARTRAADPQPRRFLPEVQALRALAVGIVVVYHLRPDLLPGGFIGVDVFFVISGFLITGHMLREVHSTGRLSLLRFWANRAGRILPAGLLVIGVTAVVAPLVVAPTEWEQLRRQALASVFYVQNWVLAGDSVDYLAADNAPTPFQHYWSLAVEEQFYLLWPLVMVLMAALAARWARRGGGRAPVDAFVLAGFGLVVVASFVWGLIESPRDPSAYFATTTRLWELGVGGVLAVLLRDTFRFPLARSALALAGLAGITVGAFVLTGAMPFPGVAALVPVLGAVAVVAAGRTRGPGSLTWLVDRSWVQWLGNASYSVYLWHFPVIICFMAVVDRRPSILESLVLVGATLLLSALSYRWVEQPVRRVARTHRSQPRVLVTAGAAMLVAGAVALVPGVHAAQYEREWREAAGSVAVEEGSGLGAEALGKDIPPAFVTDKPVIVPRLTDLDDELSRRYARCATGAAEDTTKECTFGKGERTLAVVGDSHVRMLATPLESIARSNGWQMVTYFHNSCPFSSEPRTIPNGPACVEANRATLERLLDDPPEVVVTSFYSGSKFRDPGTGSTPGVDGFEDVWERLERAGSRVVVVEDAPRPRKNVVECVASHTTDPARCGLSRARATKDNGLLAQAVAEANGIELLDLTDRYCGQDRCPAVIGNVMVYRDTNHITDTYARSLEPFLERALDLGAR